MRKLFNKILDIKDEMLNKVSWPSWSDLQESTIVVSIASIVIAVVILAMDLSFENILRAVYNLF